MSTSESSGSRPATRCAITIIPAHVPRIGIPASARSMIGSTRPELRASFEIVVDSPPGIASTSTRARSSGVRTSTGAAPSSPSTRACSRKSPWRARTPAFTGGSPPAGLEQTLLAELLDVEPGHRLAEAARDLRERVGVLEVRGRLDDRARPRRGILGLEDPRADEHAVHPELHHERRVGRGGEPPRGEVHDRERAGLRGHPNEVDRRAEILGGSDELLRAQALEPADLAQHRPLVADGLDHVA